MQAFISYAHQDHRAFEEFCTCLKPVMRAFDIGIWADKRIDPGHHWGEKIADAVAASDIHIMLMSNGFFSSDYIFDHELPAIAIRHNDGALTLPILIERCYWSAFVGVLKVAPTSPRGKLIPANEWKPQRTGFVAACDQIAISIENHFKRTPAPSLFGKKL
jgi:hypothetical protein